MQDITPDVRVKARCRYQRITAGQIDMLIVMFPELFKVLCSPCVIFNLNLKRPLDDAEGSGTEADRT